MPVTMPPPAPFLANEGRSEGKRGVRLVYMYIYIGHWGSALEPARATGANLGCSQGDLALALTEVALRPPPPFAHCHDAKYQRRW